MLEAHCGYIPSLEAPRTLPSVLVETVQQAAVFIVNSYTVSQILLSNNSADELLQGGLQPGELLGQVAQAIVG